MKEHERKKENDERMLTGDFLTSEPEPSPDEDLGDAATFFEGMENAEPKRDLTPPASHEQLEELFRVYEKFLLRIIRFHLSPRLQSLLDPADILQEAMMEAHRQLSQYVSAPRYTPYIWLRQIVRQQIQKLHHYYFDVKKRNIRNTNTVDESCGVFGAVQKLSEILASKMSSPSTAAKRNELIQKFNNSLMELDAEDRQIILMRHYEMLSNNEVAEELGILPNTASVRHLRALNKLKAILIKKHIRDYIE